MAHFLRWDRNRERQECTKLQICTLKNYFLCNEVYVPTRQLARDLDIIQTSCSTLFGFPQATRNSLIGGRRRLTRETLFSNFTLLHVITVLEIRDPRCKTSLVPRCTMSQVQRSLRLRICVKTLALKMVLQSLHSLANLRRMVTRLTRMVLIIGFSLTSFLHNEQSK